MRRQADPVISTPARTGGMRHFDFRFDRVARLPLLFIGVTPLTCGVDVSRGEVRIGFGPWRVTLDRRNVRAAEVTGPFSGWKAIGPRLSLADRGLTLGTTRQAGVCIRLVQPVRLMRWLRFPAHPAVTVTVDRPDELARLLRRPLARLAGPLRRAGRPSW